MIPQIYPNVCSKYEKDYGIADVMKPVIDLLNNLVLDCLYKLIKGATVEQQLGIPDDIKLINFWFNVNSRGNFNNLQIIVGNYFWNIDSR